MAECIFCKILNGKSTARIVSENEYAIVIVPLNPVVAGHLLVISKTHVPNALTDPVITGFTMEVAARYAKGQCNLITSVGDAASQTVKHLHIHIVPRFENDGLMLPWS